MTGSGSADSSASQEVTVEFRDNKQVEPQRPQLAASPGHRGR